MATTPTTESDDTGNEQVEVGNFVKRGKLLDDLTKAIIDPRPTDNAKEVKQRLKISQVCDFKQQLEVGVANTAPTALGGYIKQYVRDNSSDNTELPPATRFLINPDSMQSNRSAKLMRRPGADATFLQELTSAKKIVTHLATRPPTWTLKDGAVHFKDAADVLLNVNANVGVAFSDTDNGGGTVAWRFSDTGTNRYVVVAFYLLFRGALTTVGETYRHPLGEIAIFPEDILSRQRVPFSASLRLAVRDANGTFGRVDSVELYVERSTWVATNGGLMDGFGLFKKSIANQPDTSNYLEVIQL